MKRLRNLVLGVIVAIGGFAVGNILHNLTNNNVLANANTFEKVDYVNSDSSSEKIEFTDGSYIALTDDNEYSFFLNHTNDFATIEGFNNATVPMIAIEYLETVNELSDRQRGNVEKVDSWTIEGDIFTIYSDDSYSVVDEEEKVYYFCPIELNGWKYQATSKEDLENYISNYLQSKNS